MTKPANARKPTIFAFGFERLGITTKPELDCDGFVLNFVKYDSPTSLEEADGVIIPSGIFETSSSRPSGFDGRTRVYDADEHCLAERQKQVTNLIVNRGWLCFLLRRIINGANNQWCDTDLAKRFVNAAFRTVGDCDANPHVASKSDEFREFFDRHGIAQTFVSSPKYPAKTRVLATATNEELAFAAEVGGNFFVLPFKNLSQGTDELERLLISAISSILSYKQRNKLYLPEWLTGVRFAREDVLQTEIAESKRRIAFLEAEATLWEEYKGILCASGHHLNSVVVSVLRTFFQLSLRSEETYIEDAIIYDEQGRILYVVEIKGTNGGIKREHINQVDSHRERLNIGPETPGLLIINDFADIPHREERKVKQLDKNHLALAAAQNIRILRTTVLLELMFSSEAIESRAEIFLKACSEGHPLVSSTTKN